MPIFNKNFALNMLRTIIINGEARIRQMLERTVSQFYSNIKLVGMADGVKTGIEAIRKHKPDLVMLDIELKDGTGFDLLINMRHISRFEAAEGDYIILQNEAKSLSPPVSGKNSSNYSTGSENKFFKPL